jgi:thiol-disulfide isomerase/thioredoxin
MKKIPLLLLILLISFVTKAQEATIKFDIKNNLDKDIYILNNDYSNAEVMFGERGFNLPLVNSKATYTFKISKPVFYFAYYKGDSTKETSRYAFFLSPGDNLEFSVDALNPSTTCMVKGKGSENNQPLIQEINNAQFNLDAHKSDTLPGNVLKALKKKSSTNASALEKYISKYHPTKDFISVHRLTVQYFPVIEYIEFKGNHKYQIRKAFYRNEDKWQAVEDSLTTAHSLSNEQILNIPQYVYSLPVYVTRLKERLWKHPELLPEYFASEDGLVIMNDDPENVPKEKIINKHFTGKTAEFLFAAALFKSAINETEDNLPEIFARFKQAYPNSQYQRYIQPDITKIEERRKRTMTPEMKIVENPESLQTFEDVLKLVKGKTVLLDMWGTWCGPCRSELSNNSDAIKANFKDKGLDYLYIANHDSGKESKWKELIAYYNMTGTHVMASKNLTKDIMTKIKGTGFPTYVIIKKDGTFELSEAGFPMNREVLFKQLDKALQWAEQY